MLHRADITAGVTAFDAASRHATLATDMLHRADSKTVEVWAGRWFSPRSARLLND
jgi:hypothetical protein